jgi:fluoroquinolone transport system permease protein
MRAWAAFGLADLRNVRRDSLMMYMVLFPWLGMLLVRLIVPGVTEWLASSHNFDLVPYYPMLLGFLFVLQTPMLFGAVLGLLVLDERDDDTLTALQVTPISLRTYATYRVSVAMLLSMFYVLVSLALSGMMPLGLLPAVVPIAVQASLLAPLLALGLGAFAGNKLEGLALTKGFGILLLGPLVAYFINSDWQLLLGLLPTFWAAKAFWVVNEGGTTWPYILVGFAYHLALIAWLLRRFQAKLYQ